MSLVQEECDRFGTKGALHYSLFPRQIVQRMLKEYETADVINVPSNRAKQSFVAQGIPNKKISVTPFGVDTELFHPIRKWEESRFRVLYVGRMELLKGVHYLLQAFADLSLPNAELWLIGAIPPEIKPFFRRYEGRYRYLGAKPHRPLYWKQRAFYWCAKRA